MDFGANCADFGRKKLTIWQKMQIYLHISKKSKQIFVVLSTNYPKGALRNYSRTLVQITSLFYKNLK